MKRPKISDRELDVMKALWTLGREATVAEVHATMAASGSELAYTTVQTMLNRLTAKANVKRRMDRRSYLYTPSMKEPAAAGVAVRTLVKRFFGGSAAELAAHLVEKNLTDAEVAAIERLLGDRRKGRRS